MVDRINELDLEAISLIARDVIHRLLPATPQDLQFLAPGMIVAQLLSVPESNQQRLVEQVRTLVVASRPNANDRESAAAIDGVEQAIPVIVKTLESAEWNDIEAIASRISLIFQTSDACAALIGNALVMLAESPDPSGADAVAIVRDSMRDLVPVRSTSRFGGNDIAVLNLEAAHKQFPNAAWSFGFGPHTCPARSIAVAIGVACIETVIDLPPFDLSTVKSTGWEDLPNVWIPVLMLETEPPL